MKRLKRPANVGELTDLVGDLIDHIKVLVIAVDDLRCEVEWRARNAADEAALSRPCSSPKASQPMTGLDAAEREPVWQAEPGEVRYALSATEAQTAAPASEVNSVGPVSAEKSSAAARLARLERELTDGPRGTWPADWDGDEPPELAVGEVIGVDEELWNGVLDLRPAHVVEMGCCCEEGIGAPYLLAWQNGDGWFLRELTEQEAIELQQACLASQGEAAVTQQPAPNAMQLGLW